MVFWGDNGRTHRFVVLEYGTLKDEVSSFPASEIFTPLCEVAFFVPSLHHGLTSFTDDIRREECDGFVVILDW